MPGVKLRFKTFYRLGLIENWTWKLLWFSIPFYALFTLLYDVVITGKWSLLWLVTFTSGTLVQIILVVVAKKTFLPWLLSKPGAGAYGATFAGLLNVCRNLLVAYMALSFGLEEKIDWLQRAFNAYASGIVFLLVFVSIAGSRIQHESAMGKLKKLQHALLVQRAESSVILAAENQKLLTQTQQTLLPRIDQIASKLKSNQARVESVEELRVLVSQEVRPLSEQLRAGVQRLSAEEAPVEVSNVKTRLFLDRFVVRRAIRPISMLVLSGLTDYLVIRMMFGVDVALQNVPAIAIGFLTFLFASRLIPKRLITSRRTGMAILVTVNGLFGVPIVFFNLDRIENLSVLAMVSMVVGFPIILGVAIGNSAVLDKAREDAEVRVLQDNQSLLRETSLFEQKMWLAKRSWSFVVHGTVQAALTAAITRLSSSEDLEQYQIDLVLQDLQRAKDALSKTPELDVDLTAALNAVAATWQGICTVKWHASERAMRALIRDVNARMCVNEIVKEAVSNAVRHGEASEAIVELDRTSDELLLITVSNNGRPVAADRQNGVGSEMFDELSLSWSLTSKRASGQTVLEARLALSSISQGSF